MNKAIVIPIILILAVVAGFFGYKAYRAGVERDVAARTAAADKMAGEEKLGDASRKAKAEAEAHRLAALQAQQASEAATREVTRLRAAQATAEAARVAAEAAAREAKATRERLTREKEAAVGESRRLAELREKDAEAVERERDAALQKLKDVERQSREMADREAARLVALKDRQELELEAERSLLTRGILPADYKRRQHYYQNIQMQNADIAAENAAHRKPATTNEPLSTPAKTNTP